MNARQRLFEHLDPIPVPASIRDHLLDAYRTEVLREAKAEVVAWLVKKADEGTPIADLASKADRGAIRIFLNAEEKATAPAATATPTPFIEDARLRALHDAMTANSGQWRSSDALRAVRDAGSRGVSRGVASRLLRALVDKGLATAHGPDDGRFYTATTTGEDGRS